MQTRYSSKLARDQTSNPSSFTNPTPKGRFHISSKQKVENSHFEEHLTPVATMTDNRTMAEMLRAPTEGCAEAIIVPPILAEQFELKHSLTPTSELAKLTHAVNQQTSAVTTAMTAMLKQFQSNPPSAHVKAVEEICGTCGGAHLYYQCLASGGNTFPEYRDNIQGYVPEATGNYNQGNPGYRPQGVANQMRPPGSGSLLRNTIANPKGEFKAITTRSGLVTNGPTIPNPPKSVNPEEDECVEEKYTDLDHAKYTIKVPPPPSSFTDEQRFYFKVGNSPGNTIANLKGELRAITTCSGLVTDGPTVPNPPKSVNPAEDECVEDTYTDPDLAEYTIKVPPPPPVQKPKPPIQRNFVLHTRDSLPSHISYPSRMLKQKHELKCKALADLGASINLMPLSVWKKLGLPDLIPTRMTLELANRAICTHDGIARDVFVPVGKFTFPADFVVVDYESDPRVPLILGRPFLRTGRALIDVHGEEMILRDGDEREDYLEVLVSNKQSDNPTFSLHKEIASPKVIHKFHDSKGCTFLSEELPDIDSFNDIDSYFDDDPLSGSTTYSANSLLEEFADELALITYPLDYDDNRTCDIESDIREIEFLLYQGEDSDFKDSVDQSDLTNLDDLFVDPTPEMFTNEQPPDYSFPLRFDVYPDDFLEIESDANFDDDLFDSKREKIKGAELLIDQLDLPCDILSEYDFFNSHDFSGMMFCPLLIMRTRSLIQ
nr:reverse transcriptase domain-containing protein [Tanacetum cinerariifolium]